MQPSQEPLVALNRSLALHNSLEQVHGVWLHVYFRVSVLGATQIPGLLQPGIQDLVEAEEEVGTVAQVCTGWESTGFF